MHELGAGRYAALREAIRASCEAFGPAYWRQVDEERAFPEEFVQSLTLGGWLASMIPAEYGGGGLGLAEASVIMEEINRSGGNGTCCHGQFYAMGTLIRHGSAEQRERWLPRISSGELRMQSMSISEAQAGSESTAITTSAVRRGNRYVVNGRKSWISRVRHSDGVMMLVRTTPLDQVARKTDGLSLLLIALHESVGQGLTIRPVQNDLNQEVSEFLIEDLEVPVDRLIGEEGRAFEYILDLLAAEHVLAAGECIGDAHWFLERAGRYAHERVVFGRAIGRNQGVQFPLAQAYMETEAADLVRFRAADLFDRGERCGIEANMAKYLCAKAAWEAADVALQVHGGFGFTSAYDVERKFRQTRVHQVAPLSTNMLLAYVAERALGLPKSF